MTQHIEEARRLRAMREYREDIMKVAEAVRAAVNDSARNDEQAGVIAAALAAAEERGRIEERERFREAIRKAGLKARDEVVEGLAGDGSPDNDLADYLERIVDACANAITKEPTP